MLYPVGLGLPFNHIVNIVIEITDPDATVTAIGAEKDALNYITNFYPPAAEKQREQAAFCDEITQFDYQTAYTAFNVVLNDTDRTSLMRENRTGTARLQLYEPKFVLCGERRAVQPVLLQHTRQCQGQLPGLRQHDQAGHLLSAKRGDVPFGRERAYLP